MGFFDLYLNCLNDTLSDEDNILFSTAFRINNQSMFLLLAKEKRFCEFDDKTIFFKMQYIANLGDKKLSVHK